MRLNDMRKYIMTRDEYYAALEKNRNTLEHKSHKYIDKHKSKKGNWVYEYTKTDSGVDRNKLTYDTSYLDANKTRVYSSESTLKPSKDKKTTSSTFEVNKDSKKHIYRTTNYHMDDDTKYDMQVDLLNNKKTYKELVNEHTNNGKESTHALTTSDEKTSKDGKTVYHNTYNRIEHDKSTVNKIVSARSGQPVSKLAIDASATINKGREYLSKSLKYISTAQKVKNIKKSIGK